MFSVAEKKIQLARAGRFFVRLTDHYFAETKTFNAEIAPSGQQHVPWNRRGEHPRKPIVEGEAWGKLWESAWLHLNGEIPEAWNGRPVAFFLNVGGEALLFDRNGVPEASFTNTSVFASQYRRELHFHTASAHPEPLDLWLELAANGVLGAETNPDCPGAACDVGYIRQLRYGVFRPEVRQLRLRVELALSLLNVRREGVNCVESCTAAAFPAGSYHESRVLAALAAAIDRYADNPANAQAAINELEQVLQVPAPADAMKVAAIGHAHIDSAWLWPVRETVRKIGRTFANQLRMLKQFPDYRFGASQAQHYAFAKEHYPELYAKIKAAVREGRWEIQGGMWVECDCNLTGGESLVRQFLHGKNFFRDEFGVDVQNLWLPDVFGYSAALPQIIRKSGCRFFLTQKLCWNNYNRFPYHAFHWYGIDNSEVLTFFPPEDNYNTMLTPNQLNYGAANLSENHLLDEYISLFGIGDGGGGASEEFIERGRLCADLNGCPKVHFDRADRFFDRLETRAASLPAWHGELYFEMHRGTLTSQARIKRDNRRCEQQLAQTESLLSLLPPERYPHEQLDKLWKTLLLNQFHDILPGSSIGEVYETAAREHAEILAECERLQLQAAETLWSAAPGALTLWNSLDVMAEVTVTLPPDWNSVAEATVVTGVNGKQVRLTLPPGATVLHRIDGTAQSAQPESTLVLENARIRYRFNQDGELVEAFDKELACEFLASPAGLRCYADRPVDYDAWNIERYYEKEPAEAVTLTTVSSRFRSELGDELTLEFTCGDSRIRQRVRLGANSKQLEFDTEVNWSARHRMLRVQFPTTVIAEEASFDIQYGFVRRSTRCNTSYDQARFEAPVQRYADLSDATHGAALLNDGKYGCKIQDGTIDLALLRAPTWPDENADQGIHHFRYAFLPHRHTLIDSTVQAEAAVFNRPPALFPGIDAKTTNAPLLRRVAGEGVGIEVIKRAERSGATVFRLVERRGIVSECEFELTRPTARLAETDLLEWQSLREVPVENQRFRCRLKPFEIITLTAE